VQIGLAPNDALNRVLAVLHTNEDPGNVGADKIAGKPVESKEDERADSEQDEC